jgi:hypothetical protein
MKGWGVTHTTGSYRGSSFQSQDNHLSNYIRILSAEDDTHKKNCGNTCYNLKLTHKGESKSMTPQKNNNPNHKYWLGRKQKLISDMWYHLPVATGENLTWQKKIRKTWMKNVPELGQQSVQCWTTIELWLDSWYRHYFSLGPNQWVKGMF